MAVTKKADNSGIASLADIGHAVNSGMSSLAIVEQAEGVRGMNINNISDMLLGDEIGLVQEDKTGKKKKKIIRVQCTYFTLAVETGLHSIPS